MNKLALLTLPLFVTACGGESDNASSSLGPTLNLNAAYTSYVKGGSSVTGEISGYCQGTKVWTLSPTFSGTTFDGKPALISNDTQSDVMAANSNKFCTNFYSSNKGGKVYKINYDPTTLVPITNGSNPPGTVYSNQVPLPTSVKNGSSGNWFTTLTYENSVPVIEGVLTWSVTADTPTTLLFTTLDTAYTVAGKLLLFKSYTTYRINADNTLTDLRKNIQATSLATGGQGDQDIYEVYK
ncbi:MAG: hypothetical protein NBV66_03470 [Burkholderiaceae bacterium]|nr:hypothetical protein [Burkholderiaceae bacterium]